MKVIRTIGSNAEPLVEMALEKADAIELCNSKGKAFIEHFHKIYGGGDSIEFWAKEMQAQLDFIREKKLKYNNKPINKDQLRDWFFTAGAYPNDVVEMSDKELDDYNNMCSHILLGDTVKQALIKIKPELSDILVEKIIKKKDGYYVQSEKGKNLGGPYDTEDKAKERLGQVEYFKNKGKKEVKEILKKVRWGTKIKDWVEDDPQIDEIYSLTFADLFKKICRGDGLDVCGDGLDSALLNMIGNQLARLLKINEDEFWDMYENNKLDALKKLAPEINEGAEGKKEPGFEYVIYRTDLDKEEKAPIIAKRSTKTEAEYYTQKMNFRDAGDKSYSYEKVPKGKFHKGDDFWGPFDSDYNIKEDWSKPKRTVHKARVSDLVNDYPDNIFVNGTSDKAEKIYGSDLGDAFDWDTELNYSPRDDKYANIVSKVDADKIANLRYRLADINKAVERGEDPEHYAYEKERIFNDLDEYGVDYYVDEELDSLTEDYGSKFNSIIKFFKSWMNSNYPNSYPAYNDYVVEPDWAGGGMRITLQWTGSKPDEYEVANAIKNHFYGVTTSSSWGRFDHQIAVHVDEKACNESLTEDKDDDYSTWSWFDGVSFVNEDKLEELKERIVGYLEALRDPENDQHWTTVQAISFGLDDTPVALVKEALKDLGIEFIRRGDFDYVLNGDTMEDVERYYSDDNFDFDMTFGESLNESPDAYGLPTDDELEQEFADRRNQVAKQRADAITKEEGEKKKLEDFKSSIKEMFSKYIPAVKNALSRNKLYVGYTSKKITLEPWYATFENGIRKLTHSAFGPYHEESLSISYNLSNDDVELSFPKGKLNEYIKWVPEHKYSLNLGSLDGGNYIEEKTNMYIRSLATFGIDTEGIDGITDISSPSHWRWGCSYYVFSIGDKFYWFEGYKDRVYNAPANHPLDVGIYNFAQIDDPRQLRDVRFTSNYKIIKEFKSVRDFNNSLHESLNEAVNWNYAVKADYFDRDFKKNLPLGTRIKDKETGEEYFVAKYLPKSDFGRYRNRCYILPISYIDNVKAGLRAEVGHLLNALWYLSDYEKIDESLTEAKIKATGNMMDVGGNEVNVENDDVIWEVEVWEVDDELNPLTKVDTITVGLSELPDFIKKHIKTKEQANATESDKVSSEVASINRVANEKFRNSELFDSYKYYSLLNRKVIKNDLPSGVSELGKVVGRKLGIKRESVDNKSKNHERLNEWREVEVMFCPKCAAHDDDIEYLGQDKIHCNICGYEGDALYRYISGSFTMSDAVRQIKNKAKNRQVNEKASPEGYSPKKTGKAYKVFRVKNGKLYPPMVANAGGQDTPIGVWLDAEEGEFAGLSKTGRPQVKSTGSGNLAYRPGWHLGDVPRASQFDRKNKETGEMEFPADFVWAECDYAMDVDYQPEADEQGHMRTKVDSEGNVSTYRSDKYQHSLAGLPKLPKDGYYKYRTNPRPDTVPWVITGQMKVNRLLSDAEVNEILKKNGIAPIHRQGGDKTLAQLGLASK